MKEAVGDWFRDIVRALFGSYDPENKVRHIREVFCLAPKGSSKTTNSAGVMVTALLMNTRPRAEFIFVGETQATSEIAYSQAVGMIDADEELTKRFHVRDHFKEIRDRLNGSRLKIRTFGLEILTGPKPVGVLVDELHRLGKGQDTAKVLRQIRGGIEKNPEGFLFIITTQSDSPPEGAFRDELMMARAVRDGEFEGRTLPVLYEFPRDIGEDMDKWQNPAIWPMVMPNLGRSLQLDSLIHDWEAEKRKGKHAITVWASQHLNVEIGLNLRSDRWAGADFWIRCKDEALSDLDTVLERSEVVVIGIDGGGLDDLLGLAVLGREKLTKRWLLWSHAWAHEVVLDRRKEIAGKLRDLEAEGTLTIIADDSDADVQGVADIVEKVRDANLLPKKLGIGVDPVGISEIVDELERRNFSLDPANGHIAAVRQGWTLSDKIKATERRLAQRKLIHGGTDLMTFAVSNAKVEPRGNAISITKATAGSAKIDPLMALFNAVDRMEHNPVAGNTGRLDDFLKQPVAA